MTSTPAMSCPLATLLADQQPAPAAPPPVLPAANDEPPRLLWTVEKAAQRLSVGKTKLYGLMTSDQLPSIMLGGRRVIAEQDLVEFVERLRGGWQPWEGRR